MSKIRHAATLADALKGADHLVFLAPAGALKKGLVKKALESPGKGRHGGARRRAALVLVFLRLAEPCIPRRPPARNPLEGPGLGRSHRIRILLGKAGLCTRFVGPPVAPEFR